MTSLPLISPPGRNAPAHITQQELSDAGEQPDRNQLTRAGRALQKYLSRPHRVDWLKLGQSLTGAPTPTTAQEYNEMGQAILDHIIADSNAVWSQRTAFSSGACIEAWLPNGLGARWDDIVPPFFRTFLD